MNQSTGLHHLASWDTRPLPTMSLYLALDRNRDGRLSHFQQMVKQKELQTRSNGTQKIWDDLERDLGVASRYIEELPQGPDRGLALFSCAGKGLFQAFPLPQPVPNLLEIGPQPYIRPLSALAGDRQKTLAVLTDQRRARFFQSFLGGLEELKELEFETETPVIQKDGGQGRAGDGKLARRAKQAQSRHAKDTAQAIMTIFKSQGYQYLILGGPKTSVENLQASLHPYLKEHLAGTFNLEMSASPHEVRNEISLVQDRARKERQLKSLATLEDNLGPGGQAATGLNQVLAALFEGQVHTLFVRRGFTAPGGSCDSCGRLRHVDGLCPLCKKEMTPVEDVVNLALFSAMESGAQLEQVEGESPLDQLGEIAALLRYS